MRATQEHEITLFGGEHIASGYRGRHSGSEISKQTSRRMAVVFGGLLIGFASAATAITVRQSHSPVADRNNISAGANLSVPVAEPRVYSLVTGRKPRYLKYVDNAVAMAPRQARSMRVTSDL